MIDLIKQLPEHLQELASKLSIPEDLLKDRLELVALVLESKSLEKVEEKQNWFDLYPLMTEEQLDKLQDILKRERQKLQEIETKYKDGKGSIQKKAVSHFNDEKYYEKMSSIKQAEQEAKQKEEESAEDLLSQI